MKGVLSISENYEEEFRLFRVVLVITYLLFVILLRYPLALVVFEKTEVLSLMTELVSLSVYVVSLVLTTGSFILICWKYPFMSNLAFLFGEEYCSLNFIFLNLL